MNRRLGGVSTVPLYPQRSSVVDHPSHHSGIPDFRTRLVSAARWGQDRTVLGGWAAGDLCWDSASPEERGETVYLLRGLPELSIPSSKTRR